MKYFVHIKNNMIIGKGQCKFLNKNILNIDVPKEVYDNIEQYIYEDNKVVLNSNYEQIRLELKKQELIKLNDIERDKKLEEGVVYNNILFDSDTDQKINLLAMYNTMSDDDTILWYGLDNQPLLCAKSDLLEIGKLITDLHKFCWNNNAFIKEQIDKAKTIEELEEISVKY
ncbi:DUF4376 domain-containing protein [bacterium]|nr:DUF4376 domain-containing protein [bacterium]